jgi:predicted nucleic acid-binding protein
MTAKRSKRAMAEKYFVDTNILIYAHDRSQNTDPAARIKHERARQLIESLWTSGQGVLSTQVLQELCVNLRRKVARPLPVDEIRQLIHDYMTWEIVVNTPEAVIQALEIEVRYQTSFWDALILQAAEQSGAAVLYSEDLAAKQSYGPVRVVNPLAG